MIPFSQRYGYVPANKIFQRETFPTKARTAIWNILNTALWSKWDGHNGVSLKINALMQSIWMDHFRIDLDKLPRFQSDVYGENGAYDILKKHFLQCDWYKAWDLLEFILNDLGNDLLIDVLNSILEEENSPYRLVGAQVVEITDQNQIDSIQQALEIPLNSVRQHIAAALRLLSDKKNPDYRNSVKESISAVESVCKEITGQPNATLADALKKMKDLHPALSKSFLSLYGYTNDANGIRHALIEASAPVTHDDAVFMVVTCSAFIGYLYTKTNQTRIP